MKIRYLYILLILITIGCGTSREVDLASTETFNEVIVIKPVFALYNSSDSISELHFKISSKELLYTRPDGINYSCNLLVTYHLLSSTDEHKIVDSASVRLAVVNNDNANKYLVGKVKIKAPASKNYFLRVDITDMNRNNSVSNLLELKKEDALNRQNFLVKSSTNDDIIFRNYFKPNEHLTIYHRSKISKTLFVKYYSRVFPLAAPTFVASQERSFQFKADSVFSLQLDKNGMTNFFASKKGFYHFQLDTTKDIGLTLFNFSAAFPEIKKVEDLVAPLRYITSKDEYQTLATSTNPKAAIESFWVNVTGSQDRARDMIRIYYKGVENANLLFTSYTEGWRTDRGMFYLIYGPPDVINRTAKDETWTYDVNDTEGGTTNYYFSKINNPFTDNDYVLERSAAYKQGWEDAVDAWRKGRDHSKLIDNIMQTKQQKKEEESLIFGIRPVMESINAGKEIDRLFVQSGLKGELMSQLMTLLKQHNIEFQYVPVEKLNRLTQKNHQGVVGYISSISYHKIQDILPVVFEEGKVPLLLILDRITDVRNFGAIARTAECSGVNAIIIPTRGSAQITADAIKTSTGALQKIPVCKEEDLKSIIDYLHDCGLQIIACTEKATEYYFQIDFTVPTAIIMGSEENGILNEYIQKSDGKAKIPMLGDIGSLNVSVAAGIILYEAVSQRLVH